MRTQRVRYDGVVTSSTRADDKALRGLIDEYRDRCLWFLAPGYYPGTVAEILRVLDSIEKHGDLQAFKRAGALRRWVSASSSGASAGS
jgi:hypothetical protein